MIPVILHYALTFLCMELQEHLNFTCLPGSLLVRNRARLSKQPLLTSSSSNNDNDFVAGCANTNCLFSAQCRLSAEQEAEFASSWSPSSRAQCVCPRNCASYEYRLTPAELHLLLCGDDFTTYSGECELRKAECRRQTRLKITFAHECGGCDKCSPYAKCLIQPNGFVDCHCPECSSSNNENVLATRPASYNAVCGTDGITYQSECELNRTNCIENRFVNILTYAPCHSNGNTALPVSNNPSKVVNNARPNQPPADSSRNVSPPSSNPTGSPPNDDDDDDDDYLFQPENGSGDGDGYNSDDDDIEFDPRNVVSRPRGDNISSTKNTFKEQQQPLSTKPDDFHSFRKSDCPPLEQSKCRRLGAPCALVSNTTNETFDSSNSVQISPSSTTSNNNNNKSYAPRCVCSNIVNNCTNQQQQPVCGESITKSTSSTNAASWRRMYENECSMRLHACEIMEQITVVALNRCAQNGEKRACGGRMPARNSATGREYTCAEDLNRGHPDVQCPPATFCDVPSGRCCPVVQAATSANTNVPKLTTIQPRAPPPISSSFSCQNCNPLGTLRCETTASSSSSSSNAKTQCVCKNGVMGPTCDNCMPGYWSMPRVSNAVNGCQPCECNKHGSERSDCEQTYGRCSCKNGVIGDKCDRCAASGQLVNTNGCYDDAAESTRDQQDESNSLPSSTCAELVCKYGAECVQQKQYGGRYATCVCKLACNGGGRGGDNLLMSQQNDAPQSTSPQLVCGSDGITYTSPCHLQLEACRFQRAITVLNYGHCRNGKKNSAVRNGTRTLAAATPRSLYESCQNNYDCRTTLAICLAGRCQCPDGLIPSGDKQRCLPADTLKRQRSASSSSFSPSTTKNVPTISTLKATMIETDNIDIDDSDEDEERLAPSFDGRAYYELPALEGSNELNIEIHLRPLSKTGILLYNNAFSRSSSSASSQLQTDSGRRPTATTVGNSDFVAITMRDGLVRFVYNLGDGPVILQSQAPLTIGKRHTIVARRYHQGGMLQVDGRDVSKGRSPGTLKVLNLNDKLYIGWTPDAASYSASVYRQLGTLAGFVGCLYLVKIDGRPLDLPIPSPLTSSLYSPSSSTASTLLRAERITSCLNNACRTLPCLNGGTCTLRSTSASSLSRYNTNQSPNFYTVKPQSNNNSTTDGVVNGFVCQCPTSFTGARCERRFDPCWSTPCASTTASSATCLTTSSLTAIDSNTYKCVCTLDGVPCVQKIADATKAVADSNNVRLGTLPGGGGRSTQPTTWSKLLSTNSFAAVTSAAESTFGDVSGSSSSSSASFSRIPYFNGNSYMKLPMLENATHRFSIELWLRPEAPDGLILYNGQSRVPREADFVELAMHGCFLTFTYNLGSGSVRIRSPYQVSLNEWHTITIERDARDGRLTLDEFPRVLGTSPGQHNELNLNEPLYIGGLPFEVVFGVDGALAPASSPPAAAAGTKFFVGAIQRLIINGRHYDDFMSVWEDAIGLGIYEGPPCFGRNGGGGPCQNGGECVPVLGEFHCKCFHGFTGETCTQRIVGEGLAGDSYRWQNEDESHPQPLLVYNTNSNAASRG